MSLIVICGWSGSGKTTIANILQKQYGYHRIITYTTRSKREQEKNGQEYHFISRDAFQKMIDQKAFFEWTYFNDAYYGSIKKDYERPKSVVILDPAGVKKILSIFPDSLVFQLCLSKELARKRLAQRKEQTKNMEKRLSMDEKAFAQLDAFGDRILSIHIEEKDQVEDVVAKIVGFLAQKEAYNKDLGGRQ